MLTKCLCLLSTRTECDGMGFVCHLSHRIPCATSFQKAEGDAGRLPALKHTLPHGDTYYTTSTGESQMKMQIPSGIQCARRCSSCFQSRKTNCVPLMTSTGIIDKRPFVTFSLGIGGSSSTGGFGLRNSLFAGRIP